MNTKIKIAAIMVLTLILGTIIGAMANQAFMHNRIYIRGEKHLYCIGS